MFGINGGELLALLIIAVVVVGPERLPAYAEQLGGWVRQLRTFVRTAKDRVAQEMGDEGADVDWASLDPRRYDPRRIVREALLDDDPPPVTGKRYTTRASRAAAPVASAAAATSSPAASVAAGAGVAGAARDGSVGATPAPTPAAAPYAPPPFDADAT